MTLEVYGHPFSSYCQKVFIALYENATPFDFRTIDPDHPENAVAWARLWPLKRFPLLVDHGRTVLEATVIIEHLGLHHPGPVELVPAAPKAALPVRRMERSFANTIITQHQ